MQTKIDGAKTVGFFERTELKFGLSSKYDAIDMLLLSICTYTKRMVLLKYVKRIPHHSYEKMAFGFG